MTNDIQGLVIDLDGLQAEIAERKALGRSRDDLIVLRDDVMSQLRDRYITTVGPDDPTGFRRWLANQGGSPT